jgi:hypothetical protein
MASNAAVLFSTLLLGSSTAPGSVRCGKRFPPPLMHVQSSSFAWRAQTRNAVQASELCGVAGASWWRSEEPDHLSWNCSRCSATTGMQQLQSAHKWACAYWTLWQWQRGTPVYTERHYSGAVQVRTVFCLALAGCTGTPTGSGQLSAGRNAGVLLMRWQHPHPRTSTYTN